MFKKYMDSIDTKFKLIGERNRLEGSITIKSPDDIVSSFIHDGFEEYVLVSPQDSKKIIRANVGSFSFSQKKPYQTWDLFFEEAYGLWKKYAEFTSINKVSQVALGYLNRIMIPWEEKSIALQDYIKIFTEISDDLSMNINRYFMQSKGIRTSLFTYKS